jgi:WD40 repeat protein
VKRAPAKSTASPSKGKATAAAPKAEPPVDEKLSFFLQGLHLKSSLIEMKGSLLVHAAEEQVYVWDLASEQAITIFCEHTTDVTSVSMFSLEATGSTLIISSSSAESLIWDAFSGEVIKSLPGATHTSIFYHTYVAPAPSSATQRGRKTSAAVPALPPTPKVHVLLTHDHNIEVWDLEKAECVQIMKGHKARVNVVSIMHTSQSIAPKGATAAVAAASKKALVISASADGSLRIWNLANGECEQTLWHCNQNDAAGVDSLSVAEGGRFAVTVSVDDRSLKVWDLHPPYKCVFSQHLSTGSPQLVSLTLEDSRFEASNEGRSLTVAQIAKEAKEVFKFGVDDNANMVLIDKSKITIGTADGAPYICFKK